MSDERDPVVTVSMLTSALTDLERRLAQRISEEGATTRAHFDIMVERMDGTVKLVAELAVHHGLVLDDHESRLQRLEKRSI